MNIWELMGKRYPAVAAYKSGHGSEEVPCQSNRLVGIELEIEEFPEYVEQDFGGITFTNDGSLRNHGIEAITKPIAINQVSKFLNAFFKRFEITDRNYSERCSTHVHFNAQDLTLEQLNSICLVYQTVERLLFNFVGNDRGNNIFCVPWHQSGLTFNIVNKLSINLFENSRRWQKYSALNLIPLAVQGTLEFRHLHGTCDVKVIAQWINLIASIFDYCIKTPLEQVKIEIIQMNAVSNYREWLYNVFKNQADAFHMDAAAEISLAKGVVDTKFMLMTSKKSNLDDFLNRHVDRLWIDEAERRYNIEPQQDIPAPPIRAEQFFAAPNRFNWEATEPTAIQIGAIAGTRVPTPPPQPRGVRPRSRF